MIISQRFASRLLAMAAVALALLVLPERAAAQDASAKLEVSFNVPLKCFIQGAALIFNSDNYGGAADLDTQTNVKVSCDRTETVKIEFDGATGRYLTNQLNTFSKLRYALFDGNTSNFAALGAGGATITKEVPAGSTVNVTVAARVYAGQQGLIVSGNYTDTVTMRLTI